MGATTVTFKLSFLDYTVWTIRKSSADIKVLSRANCLKRTVHPIDLSHTKLIKKRHRS